MFAELSDYLDEKLDDSLCNELHKHLEGCEPCKAFVATLEATIQQCRTTPADTPDREQAAALRKKIITDLERALANTTAR
jgi:anti-sigma factor RsiW